MRCRSGTCTTSRSQPSSHCFRCSRDARVSSFQDLEEPCTSQRSPSCPQHLPQGRQPVFELSRGKHRGRCKPNFGRLLVKRPVAAVALIPEPAVLFTAGAVAGALGELSPEKPLTVQDCCTLHTALCCYPWPLFALLSLPRED